MTGAKSRPKSRPKPRKFGDLNARVNRGPDPETGLYYWRVERRIAGHAVFLWSGWAEPKDVDLAMMDIIRRGPTVTSVSGKVLTVGDLCEKYAERQADRADLHDATVTTQKNVLARVKARMGSVLLSSLGRTQMEAYAHESLRDGCGTDSVKKDLSVLRSAWRWGQDPSLAYTPARELPRIAIKSVRVNNHTTPTVAHVRQVLGHFSGWMWRATLLYFSTGARLSEIADIEWGDDGRQDDLRTVTAIHLEAASMHLVGKDGRHRDVPIGPDILETMRAWRAEDDGKSVLWYERGGKRQPVRGSSLKAKLSPALKKVCRELGIPEFTAHGIRRGVVDVLYEQGTDVSVAADIMGHSPAVALQHYRRSTVGARRTAVVRARLGTLSDLKADPTLVTKLRDLLQAEGLRVPEDVLEDLILRYRASSQNLVTKS